ncbi:protein ALP1-like [Phragmites australis]|uniref:protein ALP1-like n=1 Tax=Phragmites australis TaxID=29695 RepID=UPI002D773496|nr:protein ALP1-like [Phragmites australis]
MDPEDLSDSEEEDDDLMLFILPALYLASTEIATPDHTSKFSVAERICKVLEDDRGQGYDKLRVEPHILQEFSSYLRSKNLLRNTRGFSVEEQIGMFIYMLSQNASFQKLSNRFEHSTETIHRHIKACFDAVTSLTDEFVKPPSTEVHWKISSDPHHGPYFENCIGAIDGTHIPVRLSDSESAPYRNKEESLSQNMMLACDFDLNFVYVCCGREGSASDAAVLYSAMESGFQVPAGKYYLVDGGYANTPSFIAPYRVVPYHTEEQEQSNFQPRNYMELFNLRHAQLRNHIKHAIGLLKMRFPILNVATSYRKETQLKIPAAAVVLHNIIWRQRGAEEWLSNQTVPFSTRKIVSLPSGDDTYGNDVAALNSQCTMGDALRDGIAKRMWADYERSW